MSMIDKIVAAQDDVDDFPAKTYRQRMAIAAIKAIMEPTPEMLAGAVVGLQKPTDRDSIVLAEKALLLIEPPNMPAGKHADGLETVLTILADYRKMMEYALSQEAVIFLRGVQPSR